MNICVYVCMRHLEHVEVVIVSKDYHYDFTPPGMGFSCKVWSRKLGGKVYDVGASISMCG